MSLQRPLFRGFGSFPGSKSGHSAMTSDAQAIYPFLAQAGLPAGGVPHGIARHGGMFAYDAWELYRRGVLNSLNMAVVGEIGFGKSSQAKTFALRNSVLERRLEIVSDVKGEYPPLIAALGGVEVDLADENTSINPLERLGRRDTRGDRLRRESLLHAVASVQLRPTRDLSPVEQIGLSAALRIADEVFSDRQVTLPHVREVLFDAPPGLCDLMMLSKDEAAKALYEVKFALLALERGPLENMFDRPTSAHIDWNADAISVNTSELTLVGADEDAALAVAMLAVSTFFDAKRRERQENDDPRKTTRLYDEGWRIMAVPGAAAHLQRELKLSRRTGIQSVLVFHRLSDLLAAGDAGSQVQAIMSGLISECATKVVYHQSQAEVETTTRMLDLSSTEQQEMTRLQPGEALWIVGDHHQIVEHRYTSVEEPLVLTDVAVASRDSRAL